MWIPLHSVRCLFETYDLENAARDWSQKINYNSTVITVEIRERSNQLSACKFLWVTFLLSRSTTGFFSGSSKQCASTRLDADLWLQNLGTLNPERAAPDVWYFWNTEQQQRALLGRWKGELSRPDKGMEAHCSGSIHYHHKEKSCEKGCCTTRYKIS